MMDAIQGLSGSFPTFGLIASQAVNPLIGLQFAGSGSLLGGLLGQGSAIVDLSGAGQLLATADNLQNQFAVFRPGSTDSGIGQNFGSDFASFAAEAQYLVDAVNGAESNLSNLAALGGLGSSSGLAAAFAQALNDAGGQVFANGSSDLTQLSQLGIAVTPSADGGGRLTVDRDKLQAAFTSDADGAFSLLGAAAEAFRGIAAETVGQAQSNYAAAGTLSQFALGNQLFGGGLLASGSGNNLGDLLFLESLSTGGGSLQNLVALNEFNLVSTLIG